MENENNQMVESQVVDDTPQIDVPETEVQTGAEITADTEQEQQETQYYKSQEEVDKAFHFRMERERKKWEKEHQKEFDIVNRVKRIYSGVDNIDEIISGLEEQEVQDLAEKTGLSVEAAKYIYNMDKKNSQPTQTTGDEDVDSLIGQETQVKQIYPDFDLEKVMTTDNKFATMVAAGIPVLNAYHALHPELLTNKIAQKTEEQVIENIKARNGRPDTMKKPTPGNVTMDITKMSDKEILEISRRVKNGERIEF